MYNKALLLMLIVMILVPVSVFASSRAAVIFLMIEPGSRSGAMGHAYTAQVDDAFASWWNLGAMAYNRKTQIAGMHSNWFGDVFDDMYYEYLTFNTYMEDIGNVGASITYMTYGEQTETDEDGIEQGTFTSYDLAIALNYATQITESSGFGLDFKFILSDLAPNGQGETEQTAKGQGMSYAFDFGYHKRNMFIDKLDFGATLQNFGPDITYINEAQSDPLPLTLRTGLSYRAFTDVYSRLTLNIDASKELVNSDAFYTSLFTAWGDDGFSYETEQIILGYGAEFVYLDLLSLRAGYYSDRAGEIEGFSFGGGIHKVFNDSYKLSVDFAMQPAGGLTDYNKTFSIKVAF